LLHFRFVLHDLRWFGVSAGFIGVAPFDLNLHADHGTTQASNGDFNRVFADNYDVAATKPDLTAKSGLPGCGFDDKHTLLEMGREDQEAC
jgi:hypothetical protein